MDFITDLFHVLGTVIEFIFDGAGDLLGAVGDLFAASSTTDAPAVTPAE